VYLGPLEIDRCCSCRGIWLDRGELTQLKDLADDKSLRDGVRAALGDDARQPTTRPTASVYIGCPVCASPMSRRNYVDVSGIIIDRCEAHGTWLDHDDAIRLFELVVSGDEPRLRKMGQQRQERDIDARLRRIEGEQMHQAHQLRRHDRAIWASILWDLFD
jgi:Zn-finger nucleic acid-binding protein